MILKELHINHFRNLADINFTSGDGFNLIIGKNAQGKSNFIEALYSLGLGRSYRTSHEVEVISFNSNFARVAGKFSDIGGDFTIEIIWEKQDEGSLKKTIKYNSNVVFKLSEFIEKAPMALFLADDLDLIKGFPRQRRKFLDLLCSRVYPPYISALREYRIILKSRNKWLKTESDKQDPQLGEVYLEKLISLGSGIIYCRMFTLENLKSLTAQIHQDIFQLEAPRISYKTSIKGIEEKTAGGIKSAYLKTMERLRKAELKACATLAGPQRDDFDLQSGGKSMKNFASLGEIRTCAVVLKLAEVEVIHKYAKKQPLVLIDDSLKEFDPYRIMLFLEHLNKNRQIFYAGTQVQSYFDNFEGVSSYFVLEGRIKHCQDLSQLKAY